MKLFLFSTLAEAEASIQKLNAYSKKDSIFVFNEGSLVISGIGSFATVASLFSLEEPYSMVYNFGFAGSLTETLPIGSVHEIQSCQKFFWKPSEENSLGYTSSEKLTFAPSGKQLLSVDAPLYDIEKLPEKYRKEIDLIDMEGYAIAWFLNKKKTAYRLFKIVSDFCSLKSSEEIRRHKKQLSELLSQKVIETISAE